MLIADLVPFPIPAFAFTVDDDDDALSSRPFHEIETFPDPLVDITHDFLYH